MSYIGRPPGLQRRNTWTLSYLYSVLPSRRISVRRFSIRRISVYRNVQTPYTWLQETRARNGMPLFQWPPMAPIEVESKACQSRSPYKRLQHESGSSYEKRLDIVYMQYLYYWLLLGNQGCSIQWWPHFPSGRNLATEMRDSANWDSAKWDSANWESANWEDTRTFTSRKKNMGELTQFETVS